MLSSLNIRWDSSVGNTRNGSAELPLDKSSGPGAGLIFAPLVGEEGLDPGRELGRDREGEPGNDC